MTRPNEWFQYSATFRCWVRVRERLTDDGVPVTVRTLEYDTPPSEAWYMNDTGDLVRMPEAK